MKSRIVVYDFDGTIFDSPNEELGRVRYQQLTGAKYPHRGWWSRHESLNPPLVPTLPDDSWYRCNIVEKYFEDRYRQDTMMVLITGRMCKFESRILQILNHKNIKFDQYHFVDKRDLQGNNTLQIKCQKINRLIKPFHNTIELWDDREEQIEVYREYFMHIKSKTKLEKIIIHNACNMKKQVIK